MPKVIVKLESTIHTDFTHQIWALMQVRKTPHPQTPPDLTLLPSSSFSQIYFLVFLKIGIYVFWLYWVLVAAHRLFTVVRGSSSWYGGLLSLVLARMLQGAQVQ